MTVQSDLKVAVFPGDGIGAEIIDACLKVLERVEKKVGRFHLSFEILPAGAAHYLETGVDITDENMRKAGEADAILLAGMGLPDVRYPDGTEITPHLTMRTEFDLYAGVRPCKVYPNVPTPLRDPRAADIDFVVLRECTEGLFASLGKGEVIDDREARETLVITRSACEKFFDFGFKLAQKRKRHTGWNRPTFSMTLPMRPGATDQSTWPLPRATIFTIRWVTQRPAAAASSKRTMKTIFPGRASMATSRRYYFIY